MKSFPAQCLILCLFVGSIYGDISCPDHFYVTQDPKLRIFHVHDGERSLGTVVSSGYSVLDFYDAENQKQWINKKDVLFDLSGKRIGIVQEYPNGREKFFSLAIYDALRENTLAVLYEEERQDELGKGLFVFRDSDTNEPLAYARWTWTPPIKWYHHCILVHEIDHQNWAVTIVNRPRLQEKNISNLFLIWALLKRTQGKMRGPIDLKYEARVTGD